MPATMLLAQLCPDLETWPQRWRGDDSDLIAGQRILACFKPFLIHIIERGLATKTLKRHRDHLWMLGGEIIRRLNEDPSLQRQPIISTLILELGDDECGPLIWPRITEQQQDSFDATYRKLRQFLINHKSQNPSAQ